MIPFYGDESELSELEREVAVIEKAGLCAQAWMLQGMIAGLKQDSQKVHQKFEAALRASGNDPAVLVNYVQALANLKELRDAVDLVDDISDHYPDDLSILELALRVYRDSFHVNGQRKIMDRLHLLGADSKIPDGLHSRVDRLEWRMETAGANWEQVVERLKSAAQALHKINVVPLTIAEEFTEDGMYLEFEIRGDFGMAYEAEKTIHEAIANLPYSPADRLISFGCIPTA